MLGALTRDRRLLATHLPPLRDSLSVHYCHYYHDGSTIIHTYPSGRSRLTGEYTLYRMYSLHGSVFLLCPPIEEGARTDIQAVQQLQQCVNHVIAIHQ